MMRIVHPLSPPFVQRVVCIQISSLWWFRLALDVIVLELLLEYKITYPLFY